MVVSRDGAARQPWSRVPPRFLAFLTAVQPEAPERQLAAAAARCVNMLLRRRFPDSAAPLTPLIIGSHAKDTVIAPGACTGTPSRAAVDILFPLPPRACGRPSLPAASLPPVDAVASVLAARFGMVEVDRAGALTVEVAPGGGRVRVFPVAAEDGAYRPLGGREGWLPRRFDPRAEAAALSQVDRASGGKVRDLVRLLKAWRTTAALPLPSVVLDRVACEFLELWLYRRRSLLFYDWMVRDCFFWLSAQTTRTWTVPGAAPPLAIADGWQECAWRAYQQAAEASARERDDDGPGALACWRRIFGGGFGAAGPAACADSTQSMRMHSLPNGFSASKAANAAGT